MTAAGFFLSKEKTWAAMSQDGTRHSDQTADRRFERQPFDTRELADFPQADERDPPYQPWWVPLSGEDTASSH